MQKTDKKIIKNFIYHIFYQILTIVTPLMTSPYLSRTLGKEGLGQYQYTYAIAGYFAMVCMLGLNTYGNRECAVSKGDRAELSKVFSGLYCIQMGASLLSVMVYLIYTAVAGGQLRSLFLVQTFFILSYATDITWLFYGLEEFDKIVFRNTLIKLITVVSIFTLIHSQEDTLIYCAIMAGSAFLSQIVMWPFSRRYVDWRKVEIAFVKKHIKPVLLLFLPTIGVQIYATIDRIMLGQMMGMDAVGLYGSAEGIAKMPYGIVTSLTVVMMPRLSRLSRQGNYQEAEKYRKNTMQITMMIAFPICLGLMAISEKMIPWYLAEEFSYCAVMLKYLVIIILFMAWTDVIQKQCIIPMKKDTILVKSAFLTAAVNVVANLVMIPRYGIMGAVWGTIFSEALVMFYKTASVWKDIQIWEYIREILPYGIFAGIMYFCVRLVGNHWDDCSIYITFIQIITGMVVYVGLSGMWLFCHKRKQSGNEKQI
jgi:O-antigen/teichoic acid export membrane protein